jgi:hypothetical protein
MLYIQNKTKQKQKQKQTKPNQNQIKTQNKKDRLQFGTFFFGPTVVILIPDNVILAQIVSDLGFDDFQLFVANVLKTMMNFFGNKSVLVFVQHDLVAAYSDPCNSLYHNPMLASFVVTL